MNHSIPNNTTCIHNCPAKSHSVGGVEYLEMFVYDKGHKLHTRPWSKPSDTHAYIIPTSCHPIHVLENIPFSIASRITKNTSEDDQYTISKSEYTKHLENRGYHSDLVSSSFKRAEDKFRSEHPTQLDKVEKKCIPCVVDYNPGLPNVSAIINKYKHVLDLDKSLPFKSEDILVSYRRAKTIKDVLVSSRLASSIGDDRGCTSCKKGCTVCKNFLVSTKTFRSHQNDQQFYIKGHVDCDSSNVIYLINIKHCNVSYVGYTTTPMKSRWANTKSHIRKLVKNCEVCIHMIECTKHNLDRSTLTSFNATLKDELELIIIEQVRVDLNADTATRERLCQIREGVWQTRLRTLVRYGGLNVIDDRQRAQEKLFNSKNKQRK